MSTYPVSNIACLETASVQETRREYSVYHTYTAKYGLSLLNLVNVHVFFAHKLQFAVIYVHVFLSELKSSHTLPLPETKRRSRSFADEWGIIRHVAMPS